jgi:hypothetical protein
MQSGPIMQSRPIMGAKRHEIMQAIRSASEIHTPAPAYESLA